MPMKSSGATKTLPPRGGFVTSSSTSGNRGSTFPMLSRSKSQRWRAGWNTAPSNMRGKQTTAVCRRKPFWPTGLIVNGDDAAERGALAKKTFGVVILDEAHKARASRETRRGHTTAMRNNLLEFLHNVA